LVTFSDLLENRNDLDQILLILGFLTDFSCFENDQDEEEGGIMANNSCTAAAFLESNTI